MLTEENEKIKIDACGLAVNRGYTFLKFYPKECLTFARRPYRIDYYFKDNKAVVLGLEGDAISRDNVSLVELDEILINPLVYNPLSYFEDRLLYIKR